MIFEKICPEVHLDARGSLFEVYSETTKYDLDPVHMYISRSKRGTVRGFHQQLTFPQNKLVFCISGHIADFGININPLSKSFGLLKKHSLSANDGVLIGDKVAHGFECLSDECTLLYICDQSYDPHGQLNICPVAEELKDVWSTENPELSPKDMQGVTLSQAKQLLLKYVGNNYGL